MIRSGQSEIKCQNFKNEHFQKKGVKVRNITILHFVITFYNFVLRTETGWAKKVVKPILRIRNVIDRC